LPAAGTPPAQKTTKIATRVAHDTKVLFVSGNVLAGGRGRWLAIAANYGSETLNHYDHVHIATDGGGYPTGHENYYIGSMSPTPPD